MYRRRSLLKIAALRSERERQAGVNIGKEQNIDSSSITAFIGAPIPIGTGDFTLEYFGNAYWATKSKTPLIFNDSTHSTYSKGSFLVYGDSELAIRWVLFEAPMSGAPTDDSILLSAGDRETPFHFALTRKGTTVKVYFNGNLEATKEQSAVKDLGDFRLGMSNGSNMVMSRIYNYALSVEEVAAHYNDGDPSGYVLPGTMKDLTPVEIIGENSYTWTGVDDSNYSHVVRVSRPFTIGKLYKIRLIVSNWEAGNNPFIKIGTTGSCYLPDFNGNGTYEIYATPNGTPYSGVYIYAGLLNTDRRMTITVDSVELVGCIAEYLPQNIRIAQKRDFPQVVFPVAKYTPSSGVFGLNSLSATIIKNDQPQANGFSGAYTRFDAITSINLYCAYISDFIKKQVPLKITFEYRSNRILYSSNITVSPAASDAVAIDVNEGDAKIASVSCGVGATAFVFSASDPEAWLEMRVLSIEVAEGVALSWLDSAKQLPLNAEYLPPLLQSDGGYDLAANGMPQIIIK